MDDWMEFRSECISYIDAIRENAFKKFIDTVGIKDIFAYDYNYQENKFIIYPTNPSIWIGIHGKNIKILKDILSKELKEDCDIEFKEIHGKFIIAN